MKHPCSNSNIVTQNLPESLEKYKFTDLKDVVITHLGNSTTYKKSGRQLTTKQLLKPMTEFQIRDFFPVPLKKILAFTVQMEWRFRRMSQLPPEPRRSTVTEQPSWSQQAGDGRTYFFPGQNPVIPLSVVWSLVGQGERSLKNHKDLLKIQWRWEAVSGTWLNTGTSTPSMENANKTCKEREEQTICGPSTSTRPLSWRRRTERKE